MDDPNVVFNELLQEMTEDFLMKCKLFGTVDDEQALKNSVYKAFCKLWDRAYYVWQYADEEDEDL